MRQRDSSWTDGLRATDGARRNYLDFLWRTLPVSDLDCYPFELFMEFVSHAAMLRETLPWCRSLGEDVFLHYVLYPRVNDEDLSSHRPLFYQQLIDRVNGLNVCEAVLETNRWAHEMATYAAQDDRTASPLTVYRSGVARCGEESVFVTAALRSIGIPARQLYVPYWSHCDDMHAWVEVWVEEDWRFLGACEPEPVLDRGWFNVPASRAVLAHTKLFGDQTKSGALDTRGVVTFYNQTVRYAEVIPYCFRVLKDGFPVSGALVQLSILNMGDFRSIAHCCTDERGEVHAELGLGDIHLFVSAEGCSAQGICHGLRHPCLTLELSEQEPACDQWQTFDFLAPETSGVSPTLTDEQRRLRAAAIERGNRLRRERMESFSSKGDITALPMLLDAGQNLAELDAFLSADGNPLRVSLLKSLRAKDLRDITREILEDHLTGAIPFAGQFPKDIYTAYLLCPRIAYEMLTGWRAVLAQAMPEKQELFLKDPCQLWTWLSDHIEEEKEDHYPNLYWPPDAAWVHGHGDARSRRVLFVALLRAWGLPARLDPLDDFSPQYWNGTGFVPAEDHEYGEITFQKQEHQQFDYGQNWGLSYLRGEQWQPMNLREVVWYGNAASCTLAAGRYRVITTVRLPNGNQFAMQRYFSVVGMTSATICLPLRSYQLKDVLTCIQPPSFTAETAEGDYVANPGLAEDGNYALLIWMEPGAEPTEHVIQELLDARDGMRALPLRIAVFVPAGTDWKQPKLCSLLQEWEEIRPFCGNWAYNLDLFARAVSRDAERPPLLVLCAPDENIVYADCGYRVGMVEVIAHIVQLHTEQQKALR